MNKVVSKSETKNSILAFLKCMDGSVLAFQEGTARYAGLIQGLQKIQNLIFFQQKKAFFVSQY